MDGFHIAVQKFHFQIWYTLVHSFLVPNSSRKFCDVRMLKFIKMELQSMDHQNLEMPNKIEMEKWYVSVDIKELMGSWKLPTNT